MDNFVFISYKFDDPQTKQLKDLVEGVIKRLRRLRIVDGRTLSPQSGFLDGHHRIYQRSGRLRHRDFHEGRSQEQ
jgi:hypothetical protein